MSQITMLERRTFLWTNFPFCENVLNEGFSAVTLSEKVKCRLLLLLTKFQQIAKSSFISHLRKKNKIKNKHISYLKQELLEDSLLDFLSA